MTHLMARARGEPAVTELAAADADRLLIKAEPALQDASSHGVPAKGGPSRLEWIRFVTRLLADQLRHAAQWLFRDEDGLARAHGWQIQARHGGMSRDYRDPRFDYLIRYPDGEGAAAGKHCQGRALVRHRTTSRAAFTHGPSAGTMMDHRQPSDIRQAPAGMQIAISRVARPNPLVIVWRWRYELALAAGLPAGIAALANLVGLGLAVASIAVLAGLITLWPGARRVLAARAWCVTTPHRIRTVCAQAWIYSRAGKIPIVLVTTAEPFGERVRAWCRAGTSIENFDSVREPLAAACWAQEVKITRNGRFAQLVTIDVIRRAETRRLVEGRQVMAARPRQNHYRANRSPDRSLRRPSPLVGSEGDASWQPSSL